MNGNTTLPPSALKKPTRKSSFITDILILVFVVMLSFTASVVLKEYVFVTTEVKGSSMDYTLVGIEGSNDIVYLFLTKKIKNGDIVRAANPDPGEIDQDGNAIDYIIKRVIASEGDVLEIRYEYKDFSGTAAERNELRDKGFEFVDGGQRYIEGVVYLNGGRLDEPYLKDFGVTYIREKTSPYGIIYENLKLTVPKGHVFLMGDNRRVSKDSRMFGTVALDAVFGKAFMALRDGKIVMLK
ncbi:MAG: signal peptidase I [Clostridiales bacterium]|jgi:signal peptidase I|nr:signal peptidase I [Clostridiales bacterium]